jgi:membrane fusion protein (multidrug efflux system)
VVPEGAVKELQGTFTVAVVGPDDTVQVRTVEVGPRASQLWAITKGVTAGDRVITQGAQKVAEGQKVVAQPDPSAAGQAAQAAQKPSAPAAPAVDAGG